jgi:hypothetical protein
MSLRENRQPARRCVTPATSALAVGGAPAEKVGRTRRTNLRRTDVRSVPWKKARYTPSAQIRALSGRDVRRSVCPLPLTTAVLQTFRRERRPPPRATGDAGRSGRETLERGVLSREDRQPARRASRQRRLPLRWAALPPRKSVGRSPSDAVSSTRMAGVMRCAERIPRARRCGKKLASSTLYHLG